MQFIAPDGCGNSHRALLVTQLCEMWARSDFDGLLDWLGDDAKLTRVGVGDFAPSELEGVALEFKPGRVEMLTAISHGRFASADGVANDGEREVSFSHVFRFAGATKAAKIAEVRTLLVTAPD